MLRALSVYLIAGSLLFCSAARAAGEESGPEELITDRPDFTESGVVVPLGSVQVEGGFTWEQGGDDIRITSGPELLIRWGLMKRVELRIGLPDYISLQNHFDESGWGDSFIGTKIELGPVFGGWDLAGIVTASMPTGDEEFTSDEWDPGVILAAGRDLNDKWSLGSQLFAESVSGLEERVFFWGGTVVIGRSLGMQSTTGAFLELAATIPEEGDESVSIHHGYTHLLTETLQLDIHGGTGLTDSASDLFLGAGMSYRK